MSTTKLKKALAYTLASCLLIALLFLATARHMIVQGLDAAIAKAQTAQPDSANNIAALINYVKSDTHSLKNRNSAVWALGQLRDGQALETLKELYTAKNCDHNHELCQHELKKAINLCKNKTPDFLFVSPR